MQLDQVRARIVRQIDRVGPKVDIMTQGCDTGTLPERAMAESILLAPASLLSSNQLPSARLRLNLAAMQDRAVWRFIQTALSR